MQRYKIIRMLLTDIVDLTLISPAGVLCQHITRLQDLTLRNGEEIHLVVPQAVLENLLILSETVIIILGNFQSVDGLEVHVCRHQE